MNFDLNRFTEYSITANKVAVEHGWWDGDERDNRELVALIHSELSEALEEYRSGNGMAYENPDKPGKLEGIAVELIDAVIRIADFMGHHKLQYGFATEIPVEDCSEDSLPVLVAKLHSILGNAMTEGQIDWTTGEIEDADDLADTMTEATVTIFDWVLANGVDPWVILQKKHDYNKTRPYRHGNKVC